MTTAARVSIQTADFDVSAELAALRAGDLRVGAVCSFVGTVRNSGMAPTLVASRTALPPEGVHHPWGGPADAVAPTLVASRTAPAADSVVSMELEHYPGMTERAIESMIDEATKRFNIFGARVIHRVGLLYPADPIVLVAVTSAHRGESFQACEFLMDYLKTQAPFWKKEQTAQGARWVDARVSDDAALAKWGIIAVNAVE